MTLATLDWDGEKLHMNLSRYENGNTAIVIVDADTGAPFAKLSLNTPEDLGEGVFYMKDYAENEDLAIVAQQLGVFEPVNKWKQVGYRTVQAWKVI